MYRLEVTADKLNIRNSPFADPAFSNWVGDMKKGEVFNAVRVVKGTSYEGDDNWFADDGGSGSRFIAASQVKHLALSLGNNLSKKIVLKNSLDTTGTGIVIGILDTGFDKDNPSIFSACISDDDFLTQVHNSDITNDHGTKVAGIIAGNSLNVTGFAIDSKIRSYRTNDNDGNTDDQAVLNALNHVLNNNPDIDILNLSLDITSAVKDDVQQVLTRLAAKGIVTIVAGYSQLFGDVSNLGEMKDVFRVGIIEEEDFNEVKKNGLNPAYDCSFANTSITTLGLLHSADPHPDFKSSSAYTAVATGIIAKFLSGANIARNARVAAVKNFLTGNSFDIQSETNITAFKPYKNEKA